MALMLGAMTLHHIEPGPQIMFNHPEMFWGLITSMGLVNLLLVVLNLPLMGIWIKLLSVPYRGVFPAVVLFCAMGAYSIHNSTFDIWLVGACGFVGYVFHQLDLEPAPLLLGFILGPMLEQRLRGALQLSGGDWSVFISRPLSAGLLLAAVAMVVLVLVPVVKVRRAQAFDED
jgi:TctA family transporter